MSENKWPRSICSSLIAIAILMSAGCASADRGSAAAAPSVTSDVAQSASSTTASTTVGTRQVQFDGVSVDVISISGAATVKVLDSAALGAVNNKVASAIDPAEMLQKMSSRDGMLKSWLSRSGQRQLYYGVLAGTLGSWKQGQVLAYLRLADGPTCVASKPYAGPGQYVDSDGVPCNVGILAPGSGDGEKCHHRGRVLSRGRIT